jgi:phage tail protein X
MWDEIAYHVYGPGGETLISVLLDANPTYQRTVIFDAGVQLLVPQVTATSALPAPPWKTITQLGGQSRVA